MAEGGLIPAKKPKTFSPGEVMHWPPERFRYDMREAERRDAVHRMDVAGRARHLVWGPYVVLPPGRWQATARLAFDRWSCRHRYFYEFGSAKDFVRHEFTPGREGVYELILAHALIEPLKTEVRVVMIESSLGGVFEFQGANVEFLGAPIGST